MDALRIEDHTAIHRGVVGLGSRCLRLGLLNEGAILLGSCLRRFEHLLLDELVRILDRAVEGLLNVSDTVLESCLVERLLMELREHILRFDSLLQRVVCFPHC